MDELSIMLPTFCIYTAVTNHLSLLRLHHLERLKLKPLIQERESLHYRLQFPGAASVQGKLPKERIQLLKTAPFLFLSFSPNHKTGNVLLYRRSRMAGYCSRNDGSPQPTTGDRGRGELQIPHCITSSGVLELWPQGHSNLNNAAPHIQAPEIRRPLWGEKV